jgi:hypothetical protein
MKVLKKYHKTIKRENCQIKIISTKNNEKEFNFEDFKKNKKFVLSLLKSSIAKLRINKSLNKKQIEEILEIKITDDEARDFEKYQKIKRNKNKEKIEDVSAEEFKKITNKFHKKFDSLKVSIAGNKDSIAGNRYFLTTEVEEKGEEEKKEKKPEITKKQKLYQKINENFPNKKDLKNNLKIAKFIEILKTKESEINEILKSQKPSKQKLKDIFKNSYRAHFKENLKTEIKPENKNLINFYLSLLQEAIDKILEKQKADFLQKKPEEYLINLIYFRLENKINNYKTQSGRLKQINHQHSSENSAKEIKQHSSENSAKEKAKTAFNAKLLNANAFANRLLVNLFDFEGETIPKKNSEDKEEKGKDLIGNGSSIPNGLNQIWRNIVFDEEKTKEKLKLHFDEELVNQLNEELVNQLNNEQNLKNFIIFWKTRAQLIRNAISHFKPWEALDFNDEKLKEKNDTNSPDFTNQKNLIAEKITRDCNLFYQSFIEDLKALKVENYYTTEELKKVLEKINLEKSKDNSKLSYLKPSFKKLIKRFENLAKNNSENNEEKKEIFNQIFNKENEEKSKLNYKILQIFYNFCLDENSIKTSDFKEIAKEIIENNKKNQGKKEGVYQNLPEFNDEEIEEYVAKIQKWQSDCENLKIEKNKKEKKKEEDKKLNPVERFLQDVFLEIFLKKINKFYNLQKILSKNQTTENSEESWQNFKLESKNFEPKNKDKAISFYCFLHFLNNDLASNLAQAITNYAQSNQENKENYQDFVSLTNLYLKINEAEIQNFASLEDVKKIKEIFSEIEESQKQDEETKITIERNIRHLIKYSNFNRIKKCFNEKLKFTKKDEKELEEIGIENLQKNRENIHQNWVKTKKVKTNEYQNLINKIDLYNHLIHKKTGFYLFKAHQIMTEIHSRAVKYCYYFERDMIRQSYDFLSEDDKNGKTKSILRNLADNSLNQTRGKIYHFYHFSDKDFSIVDKSFTEVKKELSSLVQIRNNIAHFNHFSNENFSIIELINKLRKLTKYDLKLQNSITASFSKIFEKHGFKVKFLAENKEISSVKIESEKINHLNKKIAQEKWHKNFIEMIKIL